MSPAHDGQPPEPHDLWSAWNLDPLLLVGLVLAVWAYQRGRRNHRPRVGDGWRAACYFGAITVLGVALVSPLDALSSALASAHMVQHVLLVLVAAPLLALSAPAPVLLRAGPPALRSSVAGWRRRLRVTRRTLGFVRSPAAAWLLHVVVLWFWHAAGPYDAALRNEPLHIVEHTSFLVTGVLFWGVVIGSRAAGRVWNGLGVLLVFAMGMQSTFLSVLLVFAPTPWYSGYAETTRPWNLEPLADQQLAGAIMWVPAGAVYLAAGVALMMGWIKSSEQDADGGARLVGGAPVASPSGPGR